MQELELYHEDGSKFLISNEDEKASNDGCPGRRYMELEIVKEGNIAIALKSSNEAIIYDGLFGDVLESKTNLVFPGASLTSGSTLGITIWTVKEEDAIGAYSLITFALNGKDICLKGLRLNGGKVSAHVYSDPENSDVKVNLGSSPFKHDQGNIRINKST